jgi:cell division transport system permease protein
MSLGVYGTRHAQALLGSFGRLARNPLATALTLLVIGLALALPAALGLFVINAQMATGGFGNAVDMSVYLKSGVSVAQAQQLATDARERPGIARVTVIPATEGLREFRKYSGFGAALDALKSNPLPNVLHVVPRAGASSAADLETLRFNAILAVLRRVVLIAGVLLGAGVLAVVGNTIRLEILNRRAEIEVTKLVGGTNAFVRRPFLYTGMLYGVGGAVLAAAILEAAVLILDPSVATLAQLYGSRYSLQGPPGQVLAALFGGGMVLGWLGAWISAHRHLRSIEPRA